MIYAFIAIIAIAFMYAAINIRKSIKSYDPLNPSLDTTTLEGEIISELEGPAEVSIKLESVNVERTVDTLVQDVEKTEQAIEAKVEEAVDTVEETVKHEVEVVKAATHKKRKPKSNPADEDHIN
jgi:hypothetical protein